MDSKNLPPPESINLDHIRGIAGARQPSDTALNQDEDLGGS